jgi:lysophospholipase L1-like esterase
VATPRTAQGRIGRRLLGVAGAWLVLAGACGGSAPPSGGGPAPKGNAPDADLPAEAGGGAAATPDSNASPADAAVAPDAGAADAGSAPDAAALTGVVKMMVLGSSNEVITCWRAFLWQKLRAAGVTNFDFVGSQTGGPDCGVPGYDKDSESRSGTIVTGITAAQWTERFKAHPPDMVLMHIGGADLLQNIAPAKVIQAYTLAVAQARAVNPQVRFLVAQHTPQEPASCPNCRATVMELNATIVEWSMQTTTAASPVSPVDLFTGLDVATDTSDRVHLNMSGSQKVSDRWFAALLPLLQP